MMKLTDQKEHRRRSTQALQRKIPILFEVKFFDKNKKRKSATHNRFMHPRQKANHQHRAATEQ
jgi:hypothetical protein